MFNLTKTGNVSIIYGAIFHETQAHRIHCFLYQEQTKTKNCERHKNDFLKNA